MKLFQDKVAIITGSGRGVGRAVAKTIGEQGGNVVVSDLDQVEAEETAHIIEKNGGKAITVIGDITGVDFPKRLIADTIKNYQKIDIIVNNAGYTWDALIHKMSDEQFQKIIDVHLTAPFRIIREAAPYYIDIAKEEIANGIVNYRKIVNVSSIVGLSGNIGQANYVAAKAGIIGLTKTVAKEWARYNVNCNAVAFGMIDTRLTQSKDNKEQVNGIELGMPDKVRKIFEESIPQGRAGKPEEAADGIVYLSSPQSNYINGHVLNISGGLYV